MTIIVYGAGCVWWDTIDKTGNTPERDGISLPCCPYCGGVLYEISENDWWIGVDRHEKNGHHKYRKFIEWLRGKCFRTYKMALEIYESEVGS